ncbi:restriction endonuclease [Aliarcobacter skirrowii]|uniref:Type IIP restriction/modification system, restriction endonuclease, Fnu4HI family n=1 Tax=Aliarcobacter skirrowii CCUG 10374 TaxID=1032239 RepID=A0AAD0SMZ9_9BACT|nr:restriction endonuclease [Aliarcobacter skirrowii]AXX85098.1 type IIP restriction/modification system, restriction endonuclease, Fnu4HI family [Aliarcobacter skirrowii CCUG 10374]SUU96376.1 NgoFVII restriction endonuclease [Aliarcobacter skirrowii]
MFYNIEDEELKAKYIEYLKLTGSLSRLFSDSLAPYLYYRAAENIFCLGFEAENLSRSDISIDAKKKNIGFGLKTFLHGNGKTFQKVAEFNAIRNEYANKSDREIIDFISQARNKRLDICLEGYGVDSLIYHCLTRSDNLISIYEFPMDKVQIDGIKKIVRNKNTIQFEDGINEYSFNLSKSTLYKRFICKDSLEDIKVDILENPFEVLANLSVSQSSILKEVSTYPFIYLPLYAPSSKDLEPGVASGVNQWNAGGRDRNQDELYIPVPAWIHKKFEGFFPDNNYDKFELELPDGQILNAKMCQSGQKGLMSNPNKALGKWVLRDVLKVPVGTLVDRKYLDMIGIDSVIVFKISDTKYKIDFASTGKFEEFKDTHEN